MQTFNEADYQVYYDPENAVVKCSGSFRLRGPEYTPIQDMLITAAEAGHPRLTLDVRELQFLNSSGINTLSKFVMHVRKQGKTHLLINGSEAYPWQKKSLLNLQRLLPDLQLEFPA